MQFGNRAQRACRRVQHHALGDFQHQIRRRQPEFGQRRRDHAWQVQVVEIGCRQVHRHRRHAQAVVAPDRQLRAGFSECPVAQVTDQPALLGQRYKARRRDVAQRRVTPAGQRLHPVQAAVLQAHLRLVMQAQCLGFQRVSQRRFQRQSFLRLAVHFRAEE